MFGDRVLIFSNSAGSSDDDGFLKALEIEAKLNIAVLKHNDKVCVYTCIPAPVVRMDVVSIPLPLVHALLPCCV